MQAIRNKFRQSIQFRLTCYFLMVLLPLTVIGIYSNENSQRALERQLGERTANAMSATLEHIDMTMRNLEQLSVLMSTDADINTMLDAAGERLTPETVIDFIRIVNELNSYSRVHQSILQSSVLHVRSGKLITSHSGTHTMSGYEEDDWYKRVLQAGGRSVLVMPDEAPYRGGIAHAALQSDAIVLMRMMDLFSPQGKSNILMIAIDRRMFQETVGNLALTGRSEAFLFDYDGRLIAGTDKGSLHEAAATVAAMIESRDRQVLMRTFEREGADSMMLSAISPMSSWALALVQPEKEVYRETERNKHYTIAIAGFSVAVALFVSWIVYAEISLPLRQLAAGMKQIRLGKLGARLLRKREDELGYLTDSFNEMAREQQNLIENIYMHQLRLTQTELKFLQSQINPHFLYNTLDSIYWAAKDYEADEISEMVLNLSRFFRLSLSKGRETFTIRETIEHLKYYINVQQLRFSGRFDVVFRIAPETEQLEVLKLLIQPLAENAIQHGLEGALSKGLLDISTAVHSDALVIRVRDNGTGIDAQRLLDIRRELDDIAAAGPDELMPAGKEQFFGLRNVQARLRIAYGKQAGLQLSCPDGGGVLSEIRIPLTALAAYGAADGVSDMTSHGGEPDESANRGG